jgi:hypothetical protein
MKSLMILGALIGFLTGAAFGLAARSDGPSIFWHASVAALVSGVLVRWWGRVWVRNWKAAWEDRLAELGARRQESKPPTAPKP